MCICTRSDHVSVADPTKYFFVVVGKHQEKYVFESLITRILFCIIAYQMPRYFSVFWWYTSLPYNPVLLLQILNLKERNVTVSPELNNVTLNITDLNNVTLNITRPFHSVFLHDHYMIEMVAKKIKEEPTA